MVKSDAYDVGARNKRQLCALYMNTHAGFEHIHGLLDRVMALLEIPLSTSGGYSIRPKDDETFFPGRCAEIFLRGNKVGIFGILHPDVLANFDLYFPTSALHLDIELLL